MLPWELFVKITDRGRDPNGLVRVGAVIGPTAESGNRYWRTKIRNIRAHNLRIGSPWSNHCVTLRAQYRGRRRPSTAIAW